VEAEVEAGMEMVADVGGSLLIDQPRLCKASGERGGGHEHQY